MRIDRRIDGWLDDGCIDNIALSLSLSFCVYIYIYIHIELYIYICMYIYIYIYIYIQPFWSKLFFAKQGGTAQLPGGHGSVARRDSVAAGDRCKAFRAPLSESLDVSRRGVQVELWKQGREPSPVGWWVPGR